MPSSPLNPQPSPMTAHSPGTFLEINSFLQIDIKNKKTHKKIYHLLY